MEKKQIQNVVVPAVAVAALIAVAALVMTVGGGPDPAKPTPAGGAKRVVPSDASAEGMCTSLPAVDAPEWKPGEDGLKVWDVKEGSGDAARPHATVTIHYTGWTTDGNVFDSSVQKGQPATFPLGNLVQGWQIGIPGMKPGGIRRLYIPSRLGYGAGGRPPSIPPNADLIFEIKLISSP